MYSHRSTAFPRSDLKLKSGLSNEKGTAGPVPSGSTVYTPPEEEIVELYSPYMLKLYVPGLASSLNSLYFPTDMSGWRNTWRLSFGVNVQSSRMRPEISFWSIFPNTYRAPYVCVAVGSFTCF